MTQAEKEERKKKLLQAFKAMEKIFKRKSKRKTSRG